MVDVGLVFENNTNSKQDCRGYADSDNTGDLTRAGIETDISSYCPKH